MTVGNLKGLNERLMLSEFRELLSVLLGHAFKKYIAALLCQTVVFVIDFISEGVIGGELLTFMPKNLAENSNLGQIQNSAKLCSKLSHIYRKITQRPRIAVLN